VLAGQVHHSHIPHDEPRDGQRAPLLPDSLPCSTYVRARKVCAATTVNTAFRLCIAAFTSPDEPDEGPVHDWRRYGQFQSAPSARSGPARTRALPRDTPAGFHSVVGAPGFEAIPAGLDMTFREYRGRFPPGTNDVAEVVVKGFARPMLADLLRIIPAWRADLLVHEGVEFAAPTAGEILGIPHVAHNLVLIGYSPELWDLLIRDDYAAFRAAQRLPPDSNHREYLRYMCLQHVSESVAPVAASITDRTQLIHPEFALADAAAPLAWLNQQTDLPTVYATLGTVYNETPGLVETILKALGQDYTLIVTVGAERDQAEFGPQPPTVHIERYMPQASILPRWKLAS
jgi:hypothetical protein